MNGWYKFIISNNDIVNGAGKIIIEIFTKISEIDFGGRFDEDMAVFSRPTKDAGNIYYVSPKICTSDLTKHYLKLYKAKNAINLIKIKLFLDL